MELQTETGRSPGTRRLRAAVIGLGVGAKHIAGYRSHPNCDVVAVCDFAPERLEQAALEYPGVQRFEHADDLLTHPDIDVVSVASYDNYHHEHIIKALEHDKHVFVEKPLCLNQADARHIRARLEQRPHLRLSSNLVLRCCPRFLAVKEQIDRGDFGDLFLVEGDYNYGRLHKLTDGWRGAIDFYSVVFGGAIHIVDLLLWLTGSSVNEVAAFGNQVASRGSQFDYNDAVVAILRFANGVVGKVGVSYGCVRPHFHGLSIHGTKATFVNDEADGRLYRSRDPQTPPVAITEAYPGAHKGALLESFLDAILHGRDPVVSEEDVFRTMSVCLAIEQAVAGGRTCPVEYL